MKQLLIVNSGKVVGAGASTAKDLSSLQEGAICFFELGSDTLLTTAPTKNFAIALGRPKGQLPFLIPEVDVNTLQIAISNPVKGLAMKRKFTVPTTVKGEDYTVLFVKKNTVPHERNTWSCTTQAVTADSAGAVATALKKEIEAKLGDYFTVSLSTATLTIEAKAVGDDWTMVLADGLSGVTFAGSTDFVDSYPNIGDKSYIVNLASECAAGKGFTDVYGDGKEIYPNYPEAVEDVVLNDSGDYISGSAGPKFSTTGYRVITLRFQVGRDSAKTRDEKVWQLVHIAIPLKKSDGTTASSALSVLTGMFPAGDYKTTMMKGAAAAVVTEMVNSSDLND